MATHRCVDCKFMYGFCDSGDRLVHICIFDQSSNYLQEVGYCTGDCELDGFAEELWQEKCFVEENEND